MNYHGHIYFNSLRRARNGYEYLAQRFGNSIWRFPIRDKAIGPHPLPSFGIAFEQSQKKHIRCWMEQNTDWLIGFIHPILADDLLAHTEYAEWIGGKLELRLSEISSPSLGLAEYSLSKRSAKSSWLDIDDFIIFRGETKIGFCSMGTQYIDGVSQLGCCQLYELEVGSDYNRKVCDLLHLYLRKFPDCQRIFVSAGIVWYDTFLAEGKWLVG